MKLEIEKWSTGRNRVIAQCSKAVGVALSMSMIWMEKHFLQVLLHL